MDKKVLYALTTKIFSALKKMGIKPKIGVTTDIQRLPGLNSFNSDLSKLTEARPESLKKLIATDADFLAKANPDELRQYYNNLEYLQSTYPDVFSKAQVVTESKTGIKTLVDDINEQLKGKKSMESVDLKTGEVTTFKEPVMTAESKSRKLTKDEIADYEERIGRDAEDWLSEGTVDEAEKALKRSKEEEAYYRGQYLTGKLDPAPGEKTESRMNFLRKKAEEAEMTGDRRLISPDEMDELSNLEAIFLKDVDAAYGRDTAVTKEFNEAMQEGVKRSNEMKAMGLDPSKSKDYDKYLEIKKSSGDKDFNNYFEKLDIKTKYKGLIDDDLLKQIMIDDNPQRKAEVMATIDEALKMQEKGMKPEEIIDIIKNTTRTKQAKGGFIKGVSYKSMFSDLDRTLDKGLGTMFKKRKR
jgi:hypothetical protein